MHLYYEHVLMQHHNNGSLTSYNIPKLGPLFPSILRCAYARLWKREGEWAIYYNVVVGHADYFFNQCMHVQDRRVTVVEHATL